MKKLAEILSIRELKKIKKEAYRKEDNTWSIYDKDKTYGSKQHYKLTLYYIVKEALQKIIYDCKENEELHFYKKQEKLIYSPDKIKENIKKLKQKSYVEAILKDIIIKTNLNKTCQRLANEYKEKYEIIEIEMEIQEGNEEREITIILFLEGEETKEELNIVRITLLKDEIVEKYREKVKEYHEKKLYVTKKRKVITEEQKRDSNG